MYVSQCSLFPTAVQCLCVVPALLESLTQSNTAVVRSFGQSFRQTIHCWHCRFARLFSGPHLLSCDRPAPQNNLANDAGGQPPIHPCGRLLCSCSPAAEKSARAFVYSHRGRTS